MLALPPANEKGLNAAVIRGSLRWWQDDDSAIQVVSSTYRENGDWWYSTPIPTKSVLDYQIEAEKEQDRIFCNVMFAK